MKSIVATFIALSAFVPLAAQDAQIERAKQYSERREWAQAIKTWDSVARANPYNGAYWVSLGKAYFEAKNYSASTKAYENAVAAGQSVNRYHSVGQAMFLIAQNYALQNDKAQTLAWLKRAKETKQGVLPDIAERDTVLKKIVGKEKEYLSLFPPVLPDTISRVEGWREDLKYLTSVIESRHFNPFFAMSRAEWARAGQSVHDRIPKLSDSEILCEFIQLANMLKDGHTNFLPFLTDKYKFHLWLPVIPYEFKEGIFLRAVAEPYKKYASSKLLSIGGVPIDSVKARISRNYATGENLFFSKLAIPLYMRCAELLKSVGCKAVGDEMTLKVEANGVTSDVTMKTVPLDMETMRDPESKAWRRQRDTCSAPAPLYLRHTEKLFWYDYDAARQLVYFQLNGVLDEEPTTLKRFSDSLFDFIDANPVSTLVMDLRLNGGGNTFKSFDVIKRLAAAKKVNQKGHFYAVIGRATYSAAINLTTSLEKYTEAIFLGEPTACSPNFIGENVMYSMPYSKCLMSVSNINWIGGVNSNDCRNWIAPDVYFEPSVRDYDKNIDPVMNYVYANRKFDK